MSKFTKNTSIFNFPDIHSAGNHRGFTLLEVMVAVSIIAIVLVSIVRLQGQTISMNETIRFYAVAPLLAQAKLSEITLKPEDFEGSQSGDFGDDYPGYTWKAEIEELSIEVVESATLKVKKIDMFVDLNNGQMKFSLRHYLNAETGTSDE
ncbi:MAG: prepilin-type N-terminal cleavage/methylation domain-containing protein [Desulfosalsimonadaceae bacterium]|nr:prepilin-type N-terminal cleavage/methylation domain-containing protein [Desulfosalsimonadaceae bacterium]